MNLVRKKINALAGSSLSRPGFPSALVDNLRRSGILHHLVRGVRSPVIAASAPRCEIEQLAE